MHLDEVGGQQIAVNKPAAIPVHIKDTGILKRELKNHFIDAGIAIATDSDNPLGMAVEDIGRLHGLIIGGNAVPWPVIEEIAEEEDPVGAEQIQNPVQFLGRVDPSVYVTGNQYPHSFTLTLTKGP